MDEQQEKGLKPNILWDDEASSLPRIRVEDMVQVALDNEQLTIVQAIMILKQPTEDAMLLKLQKYLM